ncbi:TPA: hypothetical protein EYP13_04060 [Candidatus Micrarchaeota archaeon]|nr:hypothetical protein [Candidatus Micrarchaeota archaeon]
MSTRRHRMRLVVFKTLFQYEFRKDDPFKILKEVVDRSLDDKAKDDAKRYVRNIFENLKEIDNIISQYLENWTLDRLSSVDRNVLRLGTYELLYERVFYFLIIFQ